MKRCPNCNQMFSDENMFCLEDGTALLYVSDSGQQPTIAFQSPAAPTGGWSPPPTTPIVAAADNSSKWLFLIIGVLGTALVALAIFMFLPRDKGEKEETAGTKAAVNQTPKADLSSNQTSAANYPPQNSTNSMGVNQTFQTKTNPNLTPSGNWSGDWNSKSTYFTATASFTESDGKVSGRIVWTIQRTTNPKKTDKIGSTAVEYVQGTFNQTTRMLSLKGVRKDDPANIVILDKYNLNLAEDNQTLRGKSIGGNFVLRRP